MRMICLIYLHAGKLRLTREVRDNPHYSSKIPQVVPPADPDEAFWASPPVPPGSELGQLTRWGRVSVQKWVMLSKEWNRARALGYCLQSSTRGPLGRHPQLAAVALLRCLRFDAARSCLLKKGVNPPKPAPECQSPPYGIPPPLTLHLNQT